MLAKLRSKLTYPYVVSTLALFMALTGGAFALQGKNTVDSGDIQKDAVKSSDIKSPNGVKSGDVVDNGLTGTDIDESTLGQVASALNANNATNAENAANATNAQHANSADDANTLNGADPSAFLQADQATIRGPITVDDPTGGGPSEVALMSAGPITFTGVCTDFGATGRVAQVHATSSGTPGRLSVHGQDENDETMTLSYQSDIPGGILVVMSTPVAAATTSIETRIASFGMVHADSGELRTGTLFAAVNVGGDCQFGIASFG